MHQDAHPGDPDGMNSIPYGTCEARPSHIDGPKIPSSTTQMAAALHLHAECSMTISLYPKRRGYGRIALKTEDEGEARITS